MALLEIPDETVSKLEKMVPSYMRGERKATLKVNWALEEFIRAHAEENDGESRVNRTTGRVGHGG